MSQKQPYTPGEFQWSFLLPKYWGVWIAITFLMLLAILPWAIQWRLAHGLANIAWKYLKSRRKTTIRNLEVCFPEWSSEKVQQQAKQVFVDMMLGIFETLNAWYKPYWFKNRVTIEGLEHITSAQAQGKGVLLLGTHSTLLDAGGYVPSPSPTLPDCTAIRDRAIPLVRAAHACARNQAPGGMRRATRGVRWRGPPWPGDAVW